MRAAEEEKDPEKKKAKINNAQKLFGANANDQSSRRVTISVTWNGFGVARYFPGGADGVVNPDGSPLRTPKK